MENTLETTPLATYTPDPNSTLAYIRERMEAEKNGTSTQNLSKLVKVKHDATGIEFLVVGMNRIDYRFWRNRRTFEDIQHKDSGADKTDAPINRDRSDEFLLLKAVLTSDGQNLDQLTAEWLLKGERFGPSTNMVLQAAEGANPPRGDALNYNTALLLGKSSVEVTLWKLLFECGLGRALLDWAAPSATPEEKAWASHQLAKAEEAVADLGVYFDVQETAKNIGVTFREAALRKAAGTEAAT